MSLEKHLSLKRHTARWLLTGLVSLASAAAAAQTPAVEESADAPEVRRYAVEIILFRYAESVPAGNELFLPDPPPEPEPDSLPERQGYEPLADFGDPGARVPAAPDPAVADTDADASLDTASLSLEEIRLPTRAVDLRVTFPEDLKLTDVHRKLESLDAYEPVLWAGWTQDALERDLSPVIPLRRIGNAPPEFDGTFTLYLSRFLHLVVDLSLTPRDAASGTGRIRSFGDRPENRRFERPPGTREPGVVHLRIDEDRIVNDGDLRYFDHPKFGLLARVTRIEDDSAEATDAGDDTDALLPPE